jgi:hypothetical protein
MSSDNPSGAGNQQGSLELPPSGGSLTPQRLHAELLGADKKDLEAYLQGALCDGTASALHRTHRIGQSDPRWLLTIRMILGALGHRSWIYREGRSRRFWVLETTAPFLSKHYDPLPLAGSRSALGYVRGYFDADGGMPRDPNARLYLQFVQRDRESLERVVSLLHSWRIACGRVHNPSPRVDPNYWRVYVLSSCHERFLSLVGSWHPSKRQQMITRMKI